jgi:hypothetical protein
MEPGAIVDERPSPIFIFADDDRDALDGIFEHLHDEWCYIRVPTPRLVVQYAKQIAVTAIFLAAPVDFPGGGTAALLQKLLDEVGKPVVILVETWNSRIRTKWKRMGAADCIPHPTRVLSRMKGVRSALQGLALGQMRPRNEMSATS